MYIYRCPLCGWDHETTDANRVDEEQRDCERCFDVGCSNCMNEEYCEDCQAEVDLEDAEDDADA